MLAAIPRLGFRSRWSDSSAGCAVFAPLILLFGAASVSGQVPARQEGLFITVRTPIDSGVVNYVKAKTDRARQRKDRPVRTIVFDFNPGNQPAATKEFGAAEELAEFLLRLQDINTVAFVHKEVSGHTALPVLACKEIVMSADARLGAVTDGKEGPLLRSKVSAYEDVATRRGRCPAIVLKMVNSDIEVLEGTWRGGVWYIDKSLETQEAQKGFVVTRREPVLHRGEVGLFAAAQAQKFGLCNLVKENRQDVAEAYQLTASSLREDPLEGRDPRVYHLMIAEPLSASVEGRVRRQVRQAIGHRANVIVVELQCSGGATQVGTNLASFLRGLRDDRDELPVMTVAYIPERAPGAATILAMGCTEIAMRPKAEIGDFDSVVYERRGAGRVEVSPEEYNLLASTLEGLAKEQGYSPLLAQGMLDRTLTIYQVQGQKNPGEWKLITGKEWEEDQAEGGPHHWRNATLIKKGGRNGEFLKLNGDEARRVGLVQEIVDSFPDLCTRNDWKDVRDIGFDFLYRLAEFLTHPAVAVFLIMIGITCLILELKVPGVGLPGVIAAVCFVLYFWAQSELRGQLTTLAILLFILGLILIGLEIFLLPGSIVMGISGVILVILSLALATLEKKPETTQEWMSFGQALGAVGLGLAGALTLAFVVAWYLPSIPYASRLILKPPAGVHGEPVPDDALAEAGPRPEVAALLGAIGVSATNLRPAGIARFNDDFVDVVTEGGFVAAGSRVQVIEIEGNHVIVKEV